MGHVEIKTWRVKCDGCGVTKTVRGTFYELPKGWAIRRVHGCGMTGYTRQEEVCPKCAKDGLDI